MNTKKEIDEARERIKIRLSKERYKYSSIKWHEKKALRRFRETIKDKYSQRIYSKYILLIERGKGVTITIEYFSQLDNSTCHYCGGKATGLDRVDSSLGYTRENTVWCCGKCNLMKHIHSKDDFLNHITKIYKHAIERNNKEAQKSK